MLRECVHLQLFLCVDISSLIIHASVQTRKQLMTAMRIKETKYSLNEILNFAIYFLSAHVHKTFLLATIM